MTFTHATAIIEEGVELGENVQVWDNAHIRKRAKIGSYSIVGGKSIIAYDVTIGSRVKINAMVYICTGVLIEEMCMISAGVIFTNDVFPRAMNRDLTALETSEPTDNTLSTLVRKGCTIGANATIGPGVTLGAFSMVGMGAVVTRDVPPYGLVVGNPARVIGYVCVCGPKLNVSSNPISCDYCQRKYFWSTQGGLCHYE